MSREIKFRAWVNGFLPEQSGMYYAVELLRPLTSGEYDRINVARSLDDVGIGKWSKVKSEEEPFILMQYTGLTDKNGVEIYEGDVLKVRMQEPDELEPWEFQPIVVWSKEEARFELQWGSFIYLISSPHQSLEVIGNICENPELLEAT